MTEYQSGDQMHWHLAKTNGVTHRTGGKQSGA